MKERVKELKVFLHAFTFLTSFFQLHVPHAVQSLKKIRTSKPVYESISLAKIIVGVIDRMVQRVNEKRIPHQFQAPWRPFC